MLIDTRKSPWAKAHPLPQEWIHWKDGLWKERFTVCVNSMVPHIRSVFEDNSGIFHVVENFRVAAGIHDGGHEGTPFGDGDFYKWMEAAVYAAIKGGDKKLEADLEDYVALIGKCQRPDGYLSTKQIISEMKGDSGARNKDINEFEVYNFGHLFTSACVYKRLTGKDSFLSIAAKAADYLGRMYEDAIKTGNVKTAVCPSHYMGLIELYRTTGEKKYLELAALCVNIRDSVKDGTDDNQDRLPLREHRKITGHGVRSTYLYAGLADLYAETGEADFQEVLDSCWENLVTQKMYITGGCGALYQGVSPLWDFLHGGKTHQSFGYEYQLPNITAYNETCAALGSIFWNYRMFTIKPEAVYFDIIERTMLNLALAAVSLDGKKYFYENMLRRTKGLDYKLTWPLERDDQLTCYCCPSNLVRVIAQSMEYAYMVSA
ncbi:MAG: glycoside hydrolase family 127 protein, partial [Treponema sp.]|nr:glycoside hydrolase family 127 protein [Treponema sp.]